MLLQLHSCAFVFAAAAACCLGSGFWRSSQLVFSCVCNFDLINCSSSNSNYNISSNNCQSPV